MDINGICDVGGAGRVSEEEEEEEEEYGDAEGAEGADGAEEDECAEGAEEDEGAEGGADTWYPVEHGVGAKGTNVVLRTYWSSMVAYVLRVCVVCFGFGFDFGLGVGLVPT